jgi:hypothetical protein
MNSPPEKTRPAANRARSTKRLIDAGYTANRGLQLACVTAHAVVEINSKLDDLLVLAQQQIDLLRRLVEQGVKR